jgi:adenine-specific DNA-methyltransferase
MPPKKKPRSKIDVESLRHKDKRSNIPTEELRGFAAEDEAHPKSMQYPRDPTLDPQLVWKGKDEQDREDLEVPVVPIYIQEKIHPQAIIEEVRRRGAIAEPQAQLDLFSDFNGIDTFEKKVDFYHWPMHWSNRMVLGDSLLAMTSLAEKEGLKGKVQMIYIDPPYGIKFGSNWQVSTRKRDVKDGGIADMAREPEVVKAFRDTWALGIHSYLTYLRDRFVTARELLTDTGSIFVQIGDENVHRVRAVMDEVFGDDNFVSLVPFKKTTGAGSPSGGTDTLASIVDYVLWYAKSRSEIKYHQLYRGKEVGGEGSAQYTYFEAPSGQRQRGTKEELQALPAGFRVFRADQLTSQSSGGPQFFAFTLDGREFSARRSGWKTTQQGMARLVSSHRIIAVGNTPSYVRFIDDFPGHSTE